MKSLLFIFIVFLQFAAISQDTLVIYYDEDWSEIKRKNKAVYFRKMYQLSEETWQVKDYFIEGNLQMSGQYYSAKTETKKGTFTYYYKNGNIKSKGDYIANMKDGTWVQYYKDGKKQKESKYERGKWLSSKRWDADGNVSDGRKPIDFAEVNPQFPGGDAAMGRFIQENFAYPEKAREKGEQGIVYVQFVVTDEGNIENVKTIKGVSKSLNAEAERVVRAMPKWKPGEQDGEPVSVRYTVPFKCKLSESPQKKQFIRG